MIHCLKIQGTIIQTFQSLKSLKMSDDSSVSGLHVPVCTHPYMDAPREIREGVLPALD